jgi:hypothetical protein
VRIIPIFQPKAGVVRSAPLFHRPLASLWLHTHLHLRSAAALCPFALPLLAEMAAQADGHAQLPVTYYRVESNGGFSMPCVAAEDRRAAGHPIVRFIFQRHLETVLYGRTEGSSSPLWKILNATGMGSTALSVSKQSVTASLISQPQYQQLLAVFKSALPSDVVDPCSLGRIRCCTILPLATAAAIARTFGRSDASMAFLRAFSQPVPEAWTLREEHEQNLANRELDLVLEEKLDDLDFEAEELSFAEELTTMPAFTSDHDDEKRMKVYIMQRVPPILKSELDGYITYRTATFAARRQGGAVQSVSAEQDKTALLRFFGYLEKTRRLPEGAMLYLDFLNRPDLGDLVQAYVSWLQNTQRIKFSSIANYLNGLVALTSYAYANLGTSE